MRALLTSIRYHPLICVAFVYLALWVLFGFGYWFETNRTKGRAFIVNDEIHRRSQVSALYNKFDGAISEDTIHNVIASGVWTDNFANVADGDGTNIMRSIGEGGAWSDFHTAWFTHLNIAVYSLERWPPKDDIAAAFRGNVRYKLKLYRFRDALSRKNKRRWTVDVDDSELELVQTRKVWFERDPSEMLGYTIGPNGEHIVLPIQSSDKFGVETLRRILVMSLTVINPDATSAFFHTMHDDYLWDWRDFIYFSAMTITTVGYGDIVPANQTVRTLASIEALAGTGLLATFIGLATSRPNKE
jgi:voltage-gated potassium channel